MTANTTKKKTAGQEKMAFQAEVKQLLQLMIHSLSSNNEIVLRELLGSAGPARAQAA